MKFALVTDAWTPQVNGVVRTWTQVVRRMEELGFEVLVIQPGLFHTVALPRYREIRLAVFPREKVAALLDDFQPDAIHIAIEVGDAENLRFADNSFDVVVAQYVVTACPSPEKALNEFARVVRSGGEIVITTRIGADRGLRAGIEKTLMPVTTKLGCGTQFPFSRYTNWAAANATVELIEHTPTPPLGHFSLIRFAKIDGAAAHATALPN